MALHLFLYIIQTPTSFLRNRVDRALSDHALMRWRLTLIPTDTPSSPSSLSALTPRAGNVSPNAQHPPITATDLAEVHLSG